MTRTQVANGTLLLYQFYARRGDVAAAQAWQERHLKRSTLEMEASGERNPPRYSDCFEPHGLPSVQVARLHAQLLAIPGLRRAYLARKGVQLLPHLPCYVLGFSTTSWWRLPSQARTTHYIRQMQEGVDLPHGTLMVCIDDNDFMLGFPLRKVAGSRLA